MDVQNSTIYEGSFLSSKIPKLAFKLLLVVLLLGWSSQTVYAQCEDAHCLPDAAGNGPDASDAKLYCSNSASVLNGVINCTTAADTDGCGVDASVASGVDFNDLSLFQSENVPQQCYAPNGVPYNYIQWIRFATPEGINSVKLQGVGKMDAWAVFWAGSINTTDKTDGQITDEIRNFSTASLKYVEDACSAQNQYKTWINEDAVISNTDINVYFIALLYDVVSNGSINFKTKECEFIQTCQPEVVCPNEDITFCEGTGDLVDIQAWLDQFSNTDCGNQVTWVLTGEGLNQNFDGNAATIAALSPGTYTLTNSLVGTGLSCSSDIIIYRQGIAGDDNTASFCETADGLSTYDLNGLLSDDADGDGTWSSGSNVVDVSSPGVYNYTYTVAANVDCPEDSADFTVTIYRQGIAGDDNTASFCETADGLSTYDLNGLLSDDADGDGTWSSGSNVVDVSSPGVYNYTYTVAANVDCPEDSADFTVTIYRQGIAGDDNTASFCETAVGLSTYDLNGLLSDDADGDGTWSSGSNVVDVSSPGVYNYTYTVAANVDCPEDSADFTVTIYRQGIAGDDNTASFCETAVGLSTYDLNGLLSDDADGDGTWSSGSNVVDVSSPGVYNYTYTVAANVDCPEDSADFTVTIYRQGIAGDDNTASFCETAVGLSTYDLNGLLSDDADGDGTWSSGSNVVDVSSPGVYNYTYTVAANVDCPEDSADFTVTIYRQGIAGDDNTASFCETAVGLSTYDLNGLLSDDADGDGTWSSGSNVVDVSSPGVYNYTYTVAANVDCPEDSADFTVTIYRQGIAGDDNTASFCETADGLSTYDLNGLLSDDADGDGTWSSGSNVVDVSSPGVYNYTYTVAANVDCPEDSADFTVTIYRQGIAGDDNTASFCETAVGLSTYDLNGLLSDDADGDGTWSSGSNVVDVSSPGVYNYTYTVAANVDCPEDSADFTVTIYRQGIAGDDNTASFCETAVGLSTYDLNGLLSDDADGDGTWSSGSNVVDVSSPGVYNYTYTVAANVDCPEDSADFTVTIYRQGIAGDDNTASFCETAVGLSTYDLNGLLSDDADGDGTWSSGSNVVDVSSPGVYNYTYTVAANVDCPEDSADFTVTIYRQGIAGDDNTASFCETAVGLSTYDLNGLLSDDADGDGTWSSGSNVVDVSSPGVYNYTYTVAANVDCPEDSADFTVTIYRQGIAGDDNTASFCETAVGLSTYDLNGLLSDDADGDGTWSSGSNVVDVSSPGVYNYTYTVAANVDCPEDSADFTVTIYRQGIAGDDNTVEFCEDTVGLSTYDLNGLLSDDADGDGTWSSGSNVVDVSAPGVYNYTYTVAANVDCPEDSADFTVTINALPMVDVQIGDTTLCVVAGDVTTVTAAPLPPGSYDYVWTMPAGWLDPNPGNVSSFETGVIGTYSVTITNTDTGCTASGSGTINPVFEQVDPISFTSEYCASDAPAILFVEGPEGVDLVWYKLVGGEKILVPDDELGENGYPLAPTIPGDYVFIVEQAIGDCETSSDALSTITVNPNPDCSIMGETDVCEDILQTYTYNGAGGDISYEWGVSGDGAIDGGNTGSSVDIIPNGVGSYSVTLMVTDNVTGCTSMCNYEVTTYDCCDSETAFGYDNGGNAGTSNICFLSDEAADLGLNTNRWGWTIEGLDLETDISADEGNQYNSYTFELYAGNGNSCDPNDGPGTLVGDVTVTRVGDNLVATYDVSDAPEGFDYKLYTGHFNASCMPFPKKKKNRINSGGPRYSNAIGFTVAPGQYTASGEGNGGDTVVIEIPVSEMDGCLDNFYVIAHAEVDICTLTPTTDQVAGIDKVVDEPAVEDTIDLSGDFNMYPIPFKNEINVQYNFNYDTDVNITVYDIKGVVVYNKSFNGYIADTKGSATIDMSRQSNQMFFVRVSTNRDVLTKTAISEGK